MMSVYIVYKTGVIYTVIVWVFQAELRTGMWNYNSDYDVVYCAENVRKCPSSFDISGRITDWKMEYITGIMLWCIVRKTARKMSVIFLRWTFICPEPPRPKSPKKYAVVIFVQKPDFAALCSGTTFEIRVL